MEFLIINANGHIEKLECEELVPAITQRILGGFFETFWIDEDRKLLGLANDDGIRLGLPMSPLFINKQVPGNVIVAKRDGVELIGLTPEEMEVAIAAIRFVR